MVRRPPPLDSGFVFDLQSPGSPSLHPEDGSVAYAVSGASRETLKNESHLELVPFSGGESRRLTSGPRDSAPSWSPDGSRLAFLRTEESEDGAPEAKPQIWLLPADGGEAEPLTALPGGVAELVWAPDCSAIYCTSDVDPSQPDAADDDAPKPPRTREVHEIYYRADTLGWRGDARRQVFRVEVVSGEAQQLTRGDYNHRALAISADGTQLAFASDRSRRRHERAPWGAELCVMPSEGGRVQRLVREPLADGGIAWSPDGARLAFVGCDADNIWQHYVHTVDTDGGEVRRLTDDALEPQAGFFPIASSPPLLWHRRRIVFLADARGSSGIYSVTRSGDSPDGARAE